MSETPWRDTESRNKPPCQGCRDRYLACSDHCKKPQFLAWKEEKWRIDQAKMADRSINSYTADQIRKNRRMKR